MENHSEFSGCVNSSNKFVSTWSWSTMKLPRSAMPNPNGLLSQIVCYYPNQGRTLNDTLMRAAYRMAYFELGKLNLA